MSIIDASRPWTFSVNLARIHTDQSNGIRHIVRLRIILERREESTADVLIAQSILYPLQFPSIPLQLYHLLLQLGLR